MVYVHTSLPNRRMRSLMLAGCALTSASLAAEPAETEPGRGPETVVVIGERVAIEPADVAGSLDVMSRS